MSNKSNDPMECAMQVMEANNHDDSAVEMAIRVAIIAERNRCMALCDKALDEYENADASANEGVLPGVYIRGYRDGVEDCVDRIKTMDAVDLAKCDRIAQKVLGKSPYLVDVMAEAKGDVIDTNVVPFEREEDEVETCLE